MCVGHQRSEGKVKYNKIFSRLYTSVIYLCVNDSNTGGNEEVKQS